MKKKITYQKGEQYQKKQSRYKNSQPLCRSCELWVETETDTWLRITEESKSSLIAYRNRFGFPGGTLQSFGMRGRTKETGRTLQTPPSALHECVTSTR